MGLSPGRYPAFTMRHPSLVASLIALSLIAACGALARQAPPVVPRAATPAGASAGGQVVPVAELDHRIRGVVQAGDSALWLWTGDQGVYRYDEKERTVVRFTVAHGLSSDQVRAVVSDRAGNIFALTEPGVLSRFDGPARGFTKLPALEPAKSVWKLGADDLWFPAGQDTGAVFRWDGASLHRLTFPTTAAGDAATLPRDKFPNAKYSPYDVYTIFKDSKGRVWFGTAILGACRYDGKSFVWVGHNENEAFGVRGIVEDRDGSIWLSNTLRRFVEESGGAGGAGYRAEAGIGKDTDGFSHFVSAVRDKDGHLWLAIMGGAVYRYDGTTWTQFLVLNEGKPIWINQVYRDREDRMWVGSNEHGVYRLEGGTFERVRF